MFRRFLREAAEHHTLQSVRHRRELLRDSADRDARGVLSEDDERNLAHALIEVPRLMEAARKNPPPRSPLSVIGPHGT